MHVVEEREHPVVVLLRDRVVFVIVTAGAFGREAEQGGAGRADAVGDVFDAVFLVDDAAFGVDDVVAVEGRGQPLGVRRIRQQVAGELFGDELAEGGVPVEGLDDPVAPPPHRAGGVVVETMGVGVAGHVEPLLGETLAEAGRVQQAPGGRQIGLVTAQADVGLEGRDLRGRGRQAGQVEGGATEPGGRLGLGRGLEFLGLEFREHEAIEGLPRPGGVGDFRRGGFLGRDEGPVLLVRSALGDPAADEFDLGRRHLAIGLGRRHLLVGVMRQQPLQDLALLRLAGDDRGDAFVGLDRLIADVEP